jgi:hypothetical protein
MARLPDPLRAALAAGSVVAHAGTTEETVMHTIQIELAKSRAADMQGQAERARLVRAARVARVARPAQPGSRSARRRAAPRALALRLLRLS